MGLEVGQGWTGRIGGQVGPLDVGRWTLDGLEVRRVGHSMGLDGSDK